MTLPNGRPKGGIRKGAGRPLSPLKSAKLAADLLERGKAMLGNDVAPHPLDLALSLMWDKTQSLELRVDMLKTVLPYCSPRLSSVEVRDPDAARMTVVIRDFSNALSNNATVVQAISDLRGEPNEETDDES